MSVVETLQALPNARVQAYMSASRERVREADTEAMRYSLRDPRRAECEADRAAALYVLACASEELLARHKSAVEALPAPAWAREKSGDWVLSGRARASAGARNTRRQARTGAGA